MARSDEGKRLIQASYMSEAVCTSHDIQRALVWNGAAYQRYQAPLFLHSSARQSLILPGRNGYHESDGIPGSYVGPAVINTRHLPIGGWLKKNCNLLQDIFRLGHSPITGQPLANSPCANRNDMVQIAAVIVYYFEWQGASTSSSIVGQPYDRASGRQVNGHQQIITGALGHFRQVLQPQCGCNEHPGRAPAAQHHMVAYNHR